MNSKILSSFLGAVICLAGFSNSIAAEGRLRVIATIPDLADIAKNIGGDHISVESLSRGTEDIHQVVMRPSFVPKINRADAVIYLGLTVEHAFLPGLLDVAANPKMRTDPVKECIGPGCIDCSIGLSVLEKPETLSRAEGEIHPYGNPHYNLDPEDGILIAKNIEKGLERIDPAHAEEYRKNFESYSAKLNAKLAEWRKWLAPLKGIKAVSYHQDVAYLGRFTGIDFVGTLEPKPGVAPTPSHLEDLVGLMKNEHVTLIIREQQYDQKFPNWLAEQTGAKIAVIGAMANALPNTDTFIKMSENNLRSILAAVGKSPS